MNRCRDGAAAAADGQTAAATGGAVPAGCTSADGSPSTATRQPELTDTKAAMVTVPRFALRHLLEMVELTEFDDWTDDDEEAYKTLSLYEAK